MDDKLRDAVNKKIGTSAFEEQFIKSFRKVFGIAPTVDKIEGGVVSAHGESWALDGHQWLLIDLGGWQIATPELLANSGGSAV